MDGEPVAGIGDKASFNMTTEPAGPKSLRPEGDVPITILTVSAVRGQNVATFMAQVLISPTGPTAGQTKAQPHQPVEGRRVLTRPEMYVEEYRCAPALSAVVTGNGAEDGPREVVRLALIMNALGMGDFVEEEVFGQLARKDSNSRGDLPGGGVEMVGGAPVRPFTAGWHRSDPHLGSAWRVDPVPCHRRLNPVLAGRRGLKGLLFRR
jgi:hypothetical protein